MDWKLKFDVGVLAQGKQFAINAYGGEAAGRGEVEAYRDRVERERKARTAGSARWENQELARWRRLAIHRDERNHQAVRGVRLFSISSINRLVAEIVAEAGTPNFAFPASMSAWRQLGRSLFSGGRP